MLHRDFSLSFLLPLSSLPFYSLPASVLVFFFVFLNSGCHNPSGRARTRSRTVHPRRQHEGRLRETGRRTRLDSREDRCPRPAHRASRLVMGAVLLNSFVTLAEGGGWGGGSARVVARVEAGTPCAACLSKCCRCMFQGAR